MRWDTLWDAGFVLLLMLIVSLFGWLVTGCKHSRVSDRCSEESHGICPWCGVEH